MERLERPNLYYGTPTGPFFVSVRCMVPAFVNAVAAAYEDLISLVGHRSESVPCGLRLSSAVFAATPTFKAAPKTFRGKRPLEHIVRRYKRDSGDAERNSFVALPFLLLMRPCILLQLPSCHGQD